MLSPHIKQSPKQCVIPDVFFFSLVAQDAKQGLIK